ncbi:MAG: universal stress protein [Bacteroidia bacterium]
MISILVPLDFSDVSTNALNYAADLATDINANIVLLHVDSIQQYSNEYNVMAYTVNDSIKINLERLNEKATQLKKETSFTGEITCCAEAGNLSSTINDYITTKAITYIVMGITGHNTEIGKALIGSTAVSISKESSIPVFIIPTNYRYKKIHSIAYASDIKDANNLVKIKSIANLFNAELSVLHVIPEDHLIDKEEAKEELYIEQKLEHTDHKTFILSNDNVSEALLHFVNTHNVDIIVMQQKEYSFLHKLLYVSTTKELAFKTTVPLLTLHN